MSKTLRKYKEVIYRPRSHKDHFTPGKFKSGRKYFGFTSGDHKKLGAEKYDPITEKGSYVKYGWPHEMRYYKEILNNQIKKELDKEYGNEII
jgi:hypothetical protein